MKKLWIVLGSLIASASFAQTDALTEFAVKNSDKITSVGKAAYNAKQNGTSVVDASVKAFETPPPPADPVASLKDKAGAAALGALFGK